jgi:hypothetical protein
MPYETLGILTGQASRQPIMSTLLSTSPRVSTPDHQGLITMVATVSKQNGEAIR